MIYLKHIPLEKAYNMRDMGGIPTTDGKAIRWQTLFRADGLSALSEKDQETLYALGIRTVLDLRSASENEMLPDLLPEGIEHIHCPMQAEDFNLQNLDEGAAAAFKKSLMQTYSAMVLKTPELLCHALCVLTESLEKGGVLFHCTAGKDRTGVLGAAVLHLMHCADEEIIADYQISRTYNRNGIDKIFLNMTHAEGFENALKSEPETMMQLLEIFSGMDFPAYLDKNGFSYAQQKKLRELLLVDIF